MGRRIPKSKRHKKLKSVDPFRKDTGVVKDCRGNRPPKTLEQEVPRSLTALFGEHQSQRRKRRPKNRIQVRRCLGEGEQVGMTRPLKGLPETLTQERYETDDQFLSRIGRHAGRAFGEARIEERFDVHIVEDETGGVTVDPRGGTGEGVSDYGARKREWVDPRRTASLFSRRCFRRKRRAREKRLREKKRQKRMPPERDFSRLRDEVPFGEVADRPPDVARHERRAGGLEKAGARNLLLKSLLPRTDRTVRRKKLSTCERRKLETERQRVVSLYREMKGALKRP